jgi:uncharacterized MAPEG superfamily protein
VVIDGPRVIEKRRCLRLKALLLGSTKASINFLETFPFFAALVIVAHLSERDGGLTLWGARLYFWGRMIYAVASAAGFSIVRSMIWNVAVAGIILFIVALLGQRT